VLNTFEGGAVATDDDALAEKMRLMQNFGFSGFDNVIYVGTNGKMSEISAAMGLCGLEAYEGVVEVNRRHYARYAEALGRLPGVRLIDYDPAEKNNFHYVVLEIDLAKAAMGRDELMGLLWAENIRARRYFYPGCHRMEPYRSLYPPAPGALPVTERGSAMVLALPTGTSVSAADVDRVCGVVRFCLEHAAEIRRRPRA
jgi:dTDP-4-amino-4,6-dideoxygalactose transaminase